MTTKGDEMSKDLLVLADEYAAATATFARALALKDEADSMSPIAREAGDKRAVLAEALAALDTAQPALSGCACRWDAEGNRITTCTRHQGWLDVVQEWADRARVAEAKLAQPPAPSEAAREYMTGYSDAKEWAGATSQAQPSQAPLSDEQKRILFEYVEQVKDGNELDYYLLGFEAAENAYGIKQGGQQ